MRLSLRWTAPNGKNLVKSYFVSSCNETCMLLKQIQIILVTLVYLREEYLLKQLVRIKSSMPRSLQNPCILFSNNFLNVL